MAPNSGEFPRASHFLWLLWKEKADRFASRSVNLDTCHCSANERGDGKARRFGSIRALFYGFADYFRCDLLAKSLSLFLGSAFEKPLPERL